MSIKEKIDKYLKNNLAEIQAKRSSPGFSWTDIAADIKVDKSYSEYIRGRHRYLLKTVNVSIPVDTTIPECKFNYQSGKEDKSIGTKEFTFTADNIPSDEEIIEHFKIDTVKYRINQVYHKTSFGGKYAITVSLLANKPEHAVDYPNLFKEFVHNHNLSVLNRPLFKTEQPNHETKANSVLLNLSDLHVGKLAWDKEVGEDYNVDLAKEAFMKSLTNLVEQATRCFGVEEFVLNIGGDFLHTNGSLNQTANGTNMNDVDTRYQKIYIKGLEILTEAVDYLCTFDNVRVIVPIVQGNHDKATAFYLGESLKAFYRNHKNVQIINDPRIRKYHSYGVTAYMLTHGDCKDDGLPLTFATEAPHIFSNAMYRYIYLGHLHKTSKKVYLTENEVGGVVLRRLNSLSVMDAWHNENNYYGARRMANAIVHNYENGPVAEFSYILKK